MQTRYDAIVVGSGMSGGWAAKELTERGLSTLVLEAGRSMDPATDYLEHEPVYEFKFRGLGDRRHEAARQFIQSKAGPFEEQTSHFFVDDVENPYTFPRTSPSTGSAAATWADARACGDGRAIG